MIRRVLHHKRILAGKLLLLVILGTGGFWYFTTLPSPLFDTSYSRIIFDRNQQLLGAHIAEDQQWRFPPADQLPDKFINSLIQFEDKRFYNHPGVDPVALARALYLNIKHSKIKSGGSTLSMQVIRLSRNSPPRTISEKIREIALATRLEMHYSKNEILRLYASHAPFGGNIVGLEAASWRYFGRSPEQLSWAESAMLAVLPNSPALIHPGRSRQRLLNKRNRLLARLKSKGIISELDHALAIKETLPDKPGILPRETPHLLDTLTVGKDKNPRVNSTIDAVIQASANAVIGRYAERLQHAGIHNLAALVIDNETLEVLAYVGNASHRQQGAHGHAIDLIRRPRSTGSTLKPFLFAWMLEDGELLPETLIPDVPVRYAGFRPQNHDRRYRGAIRAKQALASSLNIPAANMLSQYGVARLRNKLTRLGMTTLHRNAVDYGLTLILGGAEGTLWELATMYANLAHLARQQQANAMPHWRDITVSRSSPAAFSPRKRDLSIASAWMTLQALLEVSRPGTDGYWRKFSSAGQIAWKSGTSFGQRDAWALGVNPRYTVGIWAGNATGEGVSGLTGVSVAAPVLFELFSALPDEGGWFEKPDWDMKTVNICSKDGYLTTANCPAIPYSIPRNSFFDKISPYQKTIHVDHRSGLRVNNDCESVNHMQRLNWFLLPPDQAWYYRQNHADYQDLPPWRGDCPGATAQPGALTLQYPDRNAQIYIPITLDGDASKTVFKAIHSHPEKTVFWHLDNDFVGSTEVFHEIALWIKPGKHLLTLVDEDGFQLQRQFEVLEKTTTPAAAH